MKKSPWTTFLCLIIILQLVANIILWMLMFADRSQEELVSYTTKDGEYSLQFVLIGNNWIFGDDDVKVHVINNGAEHSEDKFYFRILFNNDLTWSALSTLRFEETDNGVNFYVTQGERDGETKYIVLWDNVFPIKV